MSLKRNVLVVLAAAALLALAGCGGKAENKAEQPKAQPQAQQAKTPITLSWATIGAGGTWQVLGNAMLQDITKANSNITGSCVPSNPTSTVMGVNEKKYNIGFSMTDTTADGWNGEGYFKEKGKLQGIRNIASFYPAGTHIVVNENSGINKIEDLKGKKISPLTKGTSCDLELQRLLKLYGMSYSDMTVNFLSYDDAAQQFLDGHLDALVYLTGSVPTSAVINVASQRKIKMLSIPDDKIAEMKKFTGVMEYTIPAGTYKGIDYPVKGIGTFTQLLVHKDMPDDVVYSIVKTLAENFDRYKDVVSNMKYCKIEDMAKDTGITMHPGALKFYKEKGWIK